MTKRYVIVKIHQKTGKQQFYTGFAGRRRWTMDRWRAKRWRHRVQVRKRSVELFHQTPQHHVGVYEVDVHLTGSPIYLSLGDSPS